MRTEYKKPILTNVCYVAALLQVVFCVFLVAVALVGKSSFGNALSSSFAFLFSALITVGIGQAIDFLGQSAYWTRENHLLMRQHFIESARRDQEKLNYLSHLPPEESESHV